MANRVYNAFLTGILLVTSLFLLTPLCLLAAEGVRYIAPALAMEEVMFSIRLSLKTAALATGICILVSVPVGVKLHACSGGPARALTNLLYLPMSLPHLVSGMALLLLYGRRGIGDFLYYRFHVDFIFTAEGIVLALVFVNLPFAVNMMLTALEGCNRKTVFVARTLGCNEAQAF